ncbi:hypothetical protein [Parabacteroides sp.]
MRKNIFLFLFLFFCVNISIQSQQKSARLRPTWLTASLPTPKSFSYIFLDASGMGKTLEEARQHSFVNLSSRLEYEHGLRVNSVIKVESDATIESLATTNNGTFEERIHETFQMECTENGKEINMTTRVIDEYWERDGQGYVCYVLYTVSDNNYTGGSYDDDITLTTSYGAKGFFYSLIPGVGQLYKGSKLKGGLILGGSAACAGMIVVAENQRSSYIKKMREKPNYKEFYNDKAGNWENIRNGFIGAATVLYVYNLIDAAVAPGRRRVIVKKKQYVDFSMVPMWDTDHVGMALVMNF